MREHHRELFFLAAEEFSCWVGLREPNSLAERWIGDPACVPKPVTCKAKTADSPVFHFSGLVANPHVCGSAFMNPVQAMHSWEDFTKSGLPKGYSIVESGEEKGLLKFDGCKIYADFDLMAIVKSNSKGEFLRTPSSVQADLFQKLKAFLNQRLPAPMIQHGAEFMWAEGVGARESENVFWFGPGGKFQVARSSMVKDKDRWL